MRRVLVLSVAAALGCWALDSGGAVGAPISAAAPVAKAAAPLPVAAQRLERAEGYRRARAFTGELVARRTSELGFELDGKLERVFVDEGAVVEAGDVLAELDTVRLLARRAELEAGRAGATARLAELEAGPRAETIAIARADLAEVEEELELARSMHARRAELASRQAVSREDADAFERTVDVLETRRESARQRLAELETGTRDEVLDAQRAALAQLDAQLNSIDVELDKSRLRAPFDGVVARRHFDEGSVLSTGDAVLRLVEDRALEARVGLPLDLAANLRIGQDLELRAGERALRGVVRAVLPEVERATRTATVVVGLDGDDAGEALPGETVDLEVETDFRAPGFWVATDTLRRSHRGLWAAYALVEDPDGGELVVERREVEVLYTDGDRALVRGALSPDDLVLASGAHRVVPGMRVALIDEAEER